MKTADQTATLSIPTAAQEEFSSRQSGSERREIDRAAEADEQQASQRELYLALMKRVEKFPKPFDPVRIFVDFQLPARVIKKKRETDC